MKKRWIASMLFIAMLITMMPVRAEAAGITSGDYTYTLTDGQATITAGNVSGDVVIPSHLDGNPVVEIGYQAFYRNADITSVVIPDTVKTIGIRAFYGCSNMVSLDLGNSVTFIDFVAFGYCSRLEEVVIPDSVTSTDESIFSDCTSLKSVVIGSGLTEITRSSFSACTSLESVTISPNVVHIGSAAFYGCYALQEVDFANVKTIGSFAFSGCPIVELVIPDSVTGIGQYAFENTRSLTSAILGSNVSYIGGYAFHSSSLTSITIPIAVTEIYNYAFKNCSKLRDVYYGGTEEDWANIAIGTNNEPLLNATIHFTETEETNDTLSIVEANALGVAQGAGNYTAESYYITGTVSRVKNAMHGNLYIADENGVELYIHGVHDVDGNRYDAMNPCPIPGDTITLYGPVGSYDGLTAQMLEATMTDYIPGTTESNDPEPDSHLSLAEAVALGESKTTNVYTTASYYVTGYVSNVGNAKYGNIDITNNYGYTLHLYTVYDSTGTTLYEQMSDKPEVGDRITVYGKIGNYYGKAQILNANVVERIPAEDIATVRLFFNDGTDLRYFEKYEKNTTFNLSQWVPYYTGHKLLGWATAPDATVVEYQPDDVITVTEDMDLYAVWQMEITYGDVNGDGKVNTQDRMVLTRYLAGMTGYTADMIDMTAADVNCDGTVNAKDRMILTRYLAQWTAYPELPHRA